MKLKHSRGEKYFEKVNKEARRAPLTINNKSVALSSVILLS